MTTTQKLTVTLPDGTTASRSTKRTYTHVIAILAVAKTEADDRLAFAAQCDSWGQPERAEKAREEAGQILARGDRWCAWGWAGRADLAAKTADQARKVYPTVRILPVN